jgi:hypothetical protein
LSTTLTISEIIAFAPDAASARAGQALSGARPWSNTGCTDKEAWGECQGSGKNPYQTCIDLTEPAFKCTCPSRKFPCKHGLGLFLLLAKEPALFLAGEPPGWAVPWLDARAQKSQVRAPRREKELVDPDPSTEPKKTAQREARMEAGLGELRLWLRDLVRLGLVEANSRGYAFWDGIAARMVDAQAPGAARYLREMAHYLGFGAPGHRQTLLHLVRLHLLVEGFLNRRNLPSTTVADIRTALGWSLDKAQMSDAASKSGNWAVVGQRVVDDDRLRAQRTWLYHCRSGSPALHVQYAYGVSPFETRLTAGLLIDAELAFYPSAAPLRAAVKDPFAMSGPIPCLPETTTINQALTKYGLAITQQPWLEQYPLSLDAVTLEPKQDHWIVRDTNGSFLALDSRYDRPWQLRSITAGRQFSVFGEWDGINFWPLSVDADNEVVAL